MTALDFSAHTEQGRRAGHKASQSLSPGRGLGTSRGLSKLQELPHVRGRPTPESANTTRGSRHSAGSAVGVTE